MGTIYGSGLKLIRVCQAGMLTRMVHVGVWRKIEGDDVLVAACVPDDRRNAHRYWHNVTERTGTVHCKRCKRMLDNSLVDVVE